jgi:transcriptional regulator with XRE-family HTH domain
MKERIRTLVNALNLNAGQFADEIGVQKSGMSHILSGRNNPSLDFVQKILDRFPNVNIEWLILGKGPTFKEFTGESQHPKDVQVKQVDRLPDLFSALEPAETPATKDVSSLVEENKPPENFVDKIKPGSSRENSEESRLINKKRQDESESNTHPEKKTQRIVFFYSDNTFTEYFAD